MLKRENLLKQTYESNPRSRDCIFQYATFHQNLLENMRGKLYNLTFDCYKKFNFTFVLRKTFVNVPILLFFCVKKIEH